MYLSQGGKQSCNSTHSGASLLNVFHATTGSRGLGEILSFGKLDPESATDLGVVSLRLLCLRHLKRSMGYSEEMEEPPEDVRNGIPEVKSSSELSDDSDNETLGHSSTFSN